MLFDRSALYDLNADISTLRLVDMKTAPSAYTDNDHHFIFFSNPDSIPIWRSDPVEGKAISPENLMQTIGAKVNEAGAPGMGRSSSPPRRKHSRNRTGAECAPSRTFRASAIRV